ncbi:hypothetical protein BGZ95_008937 [Linnemannia exigua]|uniref:Uncharacterized protein n=1 Tax=Linnemannia exigua TaxID=604196 RepID=A0AAD4DDU9_9FUNG|nr:hypothetical protein BGZ95_008937 [Linnemannia exigua]
MKVYVVSQMDHYDDYKRGETGYTIVKVIQDKEKAYEFAHNKQLKDMRKDNLVADNDEENEEGLPTYSRDEKDKTWKVSYGKLIKYFDKVLNEPEFTAMASQRRFLVVERTLE